MTQSGTDTTTRGLLGRAVLVGAVVPVILAAIASMLMYSWIPELPEQIAVHWSGAGPDGFGAPEPFIYAPLLVSVPYAVFVVGMVWWSTRRGAFTWSHKVLVVSSLWLAVLIGVGITGSVHVQRGLTDATNAPDVGLWMLLGLGAGTALAFAAWFVLTASRTPDSPSRTPEPLTVAAGERVSWSRTVRAGTVPLVISGVAVIVGLVAVVIMLWDQPDQAWWGILVVAGVAVVVITMAAWRITVDRRGVTARGILGWPRVRVAVHEIESVAVVQVDPTGEFGGWGWRWASGGKTGLILRAGEAIEVTRTNGKRLVITVDDAETGAATLATHLT